MNTAAIQLRAPKQRVGHWSDQRTHEETRYEDPIALPLPRKERNSAVLVTALVLSPVIVVGLVSAVAIYLTR